MSVRAARTRCLLRDPWTVPALAALALAVCTSATGAQERGRSEALLLREAAALESRGDLDAAADALRGLLERHPTSSGGLFALERILRARGTLAEVLPWADRYLEAEPGAAGTRYLKLRVLAELDSLDTLEAEARRWIEMEPGSAEPWREAAQIYERVFGTERALAFLREGRQALGRVDALALEMGDALLELGRTEEAVAEWGRAVGPDGAEAVSVLRRLQALEEEEGPKRDLVRPLVAALDAEPTTPGRRRTGVIVALESGLSEDAVRLADRVLSDLDDGARQGFLTDLARRGEEAGEPGVTLWAYRRLRDLTGDERERQALDVRIAQAALAAADTSRALEAQARLARGLPPGSPERRRVVADLIRVEAARSGPDELGRRLEGFRSEFPDAPELDELAAAVAAGLQARGESDAAAAILQGVDGPESFLERGFLLLGEDDVEGAREAFGQAVPGLGAGRATPVIQLLSLLGRLGPGGRSVVAEATVLAHRGRGADAVGRIRDGLESVASVDRPAVLAQGARLADAAGLAAEAAELRTELLSSHPGAPEVGEATLALARYRASRPDGVEEARRLLEALIVERPDAAVVPDARRELERLRRRGGERGG